MKSYLNLIFARNFIPLINKPTRISKHNTTIIDHILTNTFINENYSSGVIKTDISDHFPVFFAIENDDVLRTKKSVFVFKRDINELRLREFNESLLRVKWTNVLENTDANAAYNQFLETFLSHYNTFFPKKKIKIKTKNLASPWITRGIVKSSKRKQKLYEKFLKRRTNRNEENYKNYKRLFEPLNKNQSRIILAIVCINTIIMPKRHGTL